jgi:hypothetical protein
MKTHTVNNVNNEEKAEQRMLDLIAFRSFVHPSKDAYYRSIQPGISWRTLNHGWSAMGRSTPIYEIWNPVPGVISGWKEKLENIISAYHTAGLITSNKLAIKIGIDGTNIWKVNLETITMSIGCLENNLYKNPKAVHLVGLYVGKENRILLGKILIANGMNGINQDIEIFANNIRFEIQF